MAWITTKSGKRINTDWFLKDEQIKQNKQIADKLNHKARPQTQSDYKWKQLTREENKGKNKYGFDVTPESEALVHFTDDHWKDMAELRKKGKFADLDVKNSIFDKAYELANKLDTDEWWAISETYGEDVACAFDYIGYGGMTEDEYWALIHSVANQMKLKGRR